AATARCWSSTGRSRDRASTASARRQIAMITRRELLKSGATLFVGGAASVALNGASDARQRAAATQPPIPAPPGQSYTPVVTLNGSSLSWKMDNGVKVFHLI